MDWMIQHSIEICATIFIWVMGILIFGSLYGMLKRGNVNEYEEFLKEKRFKLTEGKQKGFNYRYSKPRPEPPAPPRPTLEPQYFKEGKEFKPKSPK